MNVVNHVRHPRKNTPVMLYCTSGLHSGLARRLLEACGFNRGSRTRRQGGESAGPRPPCQRNGPDQLFRKDCPEDAEPLSEIITSAPGDTENEPYRGPESYRTTPRQ
jgi:hypothetical protein